MAIGLSASTLKPAETERSMYSVLRALLPANDDDVAGLLLQHPFQEVGAGIDLFLPVRGLVSAGVEALDALEVLLQVRRRRAHRRARPG